MNKSTPNSKLLTIADSPFQHHLISIILFLYIHRYILMLLDASTTKEESLAYNPQGGRIVLHTACDKEVAIFAFGQDAQWRNGKDKRPHLYVEGNPVGFRDETGNNAIIGQLNAIMKHMMGSIKIGDKIGRNIGRGLDYSMRKAARGIDGAARKLVSGGKYSRNKGNDLDNLSNQLGLNPNGFFDEIEQVGHRARVGVDKWLITNRNDYSEPFEKRTIKSYLITSICKENEDSESCKMAKFIATLDYFNAREKWDNNRSPIIGLTDLINPVIFLETNNNRHKDPNRQIDIVYSYYCVSEFSGICGSYE